MICLFRVTILCFVLCHCLEQRVVRALDTNTVRNVSEIITSKGYPLEEHTIQTADGYILSLLRIPYGRNNSIDKGEKKVVLLLHGERADAKSFVLNLPNQSLGFMLPDAGYDVWLLNERGSDYSKKHVKYDTNEYSFWNFSLDEMVKYDAPATIDYILSATGRQYLYIIGYSRGNTIAFAMLSEFPQYNEKVKLLIALAPIAYIGHFKPVILDMIPYQDQVVFALNLFSHGEFAPQKTLDKRPLELLCELVAPELCKKALLSSDIVDKVKSNELATNLLPSGDLVPYSKLDKNILGLFCELVDSELCKTFSSWVEGGLDNTQPNETRVVTSSTSTKILQHFGQLHLSKKFRKYDYGRLRNLEYYLQEEPPDYDLSRITAPVALISSLNDNIADPEDVEILRKQLKSLVLAYQSPYPHKHFDFIAAENAAELLYKPVLQLLIEY